LRFYPTHELPENLMLTKNVSCSMVGTMTTLYLQLRLQLNPIYTLKRARRAGSTQLLRVNTHEASFTS